jgi:hypothetical protein
MNSCIGMNAGFLAVQNQLISWSGWSNCLKVSPNVLIEVFLCVVRFVKALLSKDAGPLGETYVLKTLTHQVE